MIPVISSTIDAIGYDPMIKTMQVNFKSGAKYKYYDISSEEHKSIIEDKSIGSKLKRVVSEKEYVKI